MGSHGMDTRSHPCPGPRCDARVAANKLACLRHWQQVPERLKRAVYAAYDGGRGAGSARHHQALADAIECMHELGS